MSSDPSYYNRSSAAAVAPPNSLGIDVNAKRYMTFSKEQHPFTKTEWFNSDTKELVFFTPRSVFSSSAQRYSDGSHLCEEVCRANMEILSLFCYLYSSIYTAFNVQSTKKKKKSEGRKKGKSKGDGDGSDDETEADTVAQEEDRQISEYCSNTYINERADALFTFMEFVPHVSDPTRMAGMKMTIAVNDVRVRFGQKLWYLFNATQDRLAGEANGMRVSPNLKLHQRITFDRYCDLVRLYTGVEVPLESRARTNLWASDALINPVTVFNHFRACHLAKVANADAAYTQPDVYRSALGVHNFPNPANVYLLQPQMMNQDAFHTYLWPHIRKPTNDDDAQRLAFIRTFVHAKKTAVSVEDEEDEEDAALEAERAAREEEVGRMYDNSFRTVVSEDNAMDIKALGRRMAARWAHVMSTAGTINERRIARTKEQYQGIDEMEQVFHVTGDVPKSIKAIAAWQDKHLKSFRNLNLPSPKQSSNLSRLADLLMVSSLQLEVVFQVAVMHVPIIKGLLGTMHVYSDEPMHCNTLISGPARLGKSFMFVVLMALLIVHTYLSLNYATPKADTSGTNENNHSIIFMEEAHASILGVIFSSAQRKTQATTGDTAESMFKDMLTKGYTMVKRMVKDEVTGRMMTQVVMTLCNNIYLLASNDSLSVMSAPVVDRFDATEMIPVIRKDHGDVTEKVYANAKSKIGNTLRDDSLYRVQRNQLICAKIFYCISAKIFPEGIDLMIARIVGWAVLKRGKQVGLINTDNARHVLRYLCLVRVLVIWAAADTLLDGELSPFKGKEWSHRDLLAFEPYLVSTLEPCVFALGLLSNSWESESIKEVVRVLRSTLFAKAISAERSGAPPFPELAEELEAALVVAKAGGKYHNKFVDINNPPADLLIGARMEQSRANKEYRESFNAMYYSVEFPVVTDAQKQNANFTPAYQYYPRQSDHETRDSDLLGKMRDYLKARMNKVAMKKENVHTTLQGLMDMTIPNQEGITTGSDHALYFHAGRAYVSKSIVNNLERNSVQSVVTEVVSKLSTTRKQLIYGAANPELPYLFKTIIANPEDPTGTGQADSEGKHGVRERVTVANPDFFNRELINCCAKSTVYMYEELKEKMPIHDHVLRDKMIKDSFNVCPSITIDGDIDRYGVATYLQKVCVRGVDLEGMPSPYPDVYRRQLRKHVEGHDTLLQYPKCFPKTAKAVNDNRKRYRNVEEMSIKAKTHRITEELEHNLPPEEDEYIPNENSNDGDTENTSANSNNNTHSAQHEIEVEEEEQEDDDDCGAFYTYQTTAEEDEAMIAAIAKATQSVSRNECDAIQEEVNGLLNADVVGKFTKMRMNAAEAANQKHKQQLEKYASSASSSSLPPSQR